MVYGNCQVERQVSDGRSQKAPNHSPSAFPYGITITRTEVAFAEKLRVAYTAFAGTFTILWVGHEAGLYRKTGVELELLYIGSSTRAVQALLGGDIDIVYSAAGAVVDANLAGADLVMIGCQYDQGQTSFLPLLPSPASAGSREKHLEYPASAPSQTLSRATC